MNVRRARIAQFAPAREPPRLQAFEKDIRRRMRQKGGRGRERLEFV